MRRLVPLAVLLLLTVPPAAVRAAEKVTLERLLRQMTSLAALAEFPDPPYVARQFSSYDRASEAPGRDSWFANYDRGFTLYDGTLKEETPYYTGGPMQMKPPDGRFPAGTRVGIAPTHKPVGGYVWVYATADDGGPRDGKIPQGYVEKSAITMDPQGHVLAEMDGPGCVTRIWSANPDEGGRVRIFLDGADEPLIEAPLQDLLGGKWKTTVAGHELAPFPDPLACERSRGFNLYFPIAYAKHCKITVEKSDIYYHVDYRTYPAGTEVETLTLERLGAAAGQIAEAAKDLATPRPSPDLAWATRHFVNFEEKFGELPELRAGEKKEVVAFSGPGILVNLQASLPRGDDPAAVLRSLVLIGTFDEAKSPQVVCPLGDFFASAPGFNESQCLPFTLAKDPEREGWVRLEARWWMPFERSAKFELANWGKGPVRVKLKAAALGYGWNDRSLHFHARWRTETMKTRPFRDWTFCDVKGRGVFVGDMLSVFNPSPAWWGEGDEKVYVNGETFPSWFGTGTEDYYGYAWGDSRPFRHAYHNQTRCDGPGSKGHTSVNRFHVFDAIPFTESLRFDMEVWHWTPNIDVTYAATSYWYARPGATDDFPEIDPKVLQTIPQAPPPFKIAGALEGEKLKVLGKSSNFDLGPQDMGGFADGQWSGDSHLWGRPPRKGEWADLEVPVAEDGTYHVVVYLTKARDYGVVQFSLDGQPLGKPVDGFHADTVVSTGPIDLGTVDLKKGTATLRVEVVGTNEHSDGLRYMWGLDCVVLRPQKP